MLLTVGIFLRADSDTRRRTPQPLRHGTCPD